jgi:hypothetical protein
VEGAGVLVNTMLRVAQEPLETFRDLANPMLDYVFFNWQRNGNGHEALQKTMALGYDAILDTKQSVYNTQIIVFVSMTVIICVIGTCIFLPILQRIETSADNIMKQFVILPTVVRSHLHNQALARVKTLRREFAQDDDAEMTSSGEEDQGDDAAHKGKNTNEMPNFHPDDEESEDEDGQLDWDDILNSGSKTTKMSKRMKSGKEAAVGEKHIGKGAHGGLYRKSNRSFMILVLRFIGPLISLLFMFILIFAVFAFTLEKAVVLTSIATASSYRASCSRQSMVSLRKLSYLSMDWAYRRNAYWVAMTGAECMVNHVRLLGFGDGTGIGAKYVANVPPVENGHASVLSTEVTNVIHEAMFGNACPFIEGVMKDFNQSYCSQLEGGFLTNGLAAAAEVRKQTTYMLISTVYILIPLIFLQLWYTRTYTLAEEQLRRLFEMGDLEAGDSWVIPEASIQYNNTGCYVRDDCYLRDVSMPASGTVAPVPLNDRTYIGDINTSVTPPPEGSVRKNNGDFLNGTSILPLAMPHCIHLLRMN